MRALASSNLTVLSVLFLFALLPWCPGAAAGAAERDGGRLEGLFGLSYREAFQLVGALGDRIAGAEVEVGLALLAAPVPAGAGMSRSEAATVKNNLADRLLGQRGEFPEQRMGERFLAMVEDGALDPVWRDYVVQKLPAVHRRPESGDPVRAAVRAKLWALARGAEGERIAGAPTVDGTALLALFRLSAAPAGEVDRAAVGREGLRMAAHCGGAAAAGAAELARRWLRE